MKVWHLVRVVGLGEGTGQNLISVTILTKIEGQVCVCVYVPVCMCVCVSKHVALNKKGA